MKVFFSVLVLIAVTVININYLSDVSWMARLIVILLGFGVIWWIHNGNKCPKCKKAHAIGVINREPIHSSAAFRKKDGNGNYHTYHRVTEIVTRQCKYCSYEFAKQETREEQLD